MKINKKLFKQVRDHIKEEPRRLAMGVFLQGVEEGSGVNCVYDAADRVRFLSEKEVPPCGTVGCIAGWVGKLVNGTFKSTSNSADLLGITNEQSLKLFYPDSWKPKTYRKYRRSKTQIGRTRVVVGILDRIIKAGRFVNP